MWPAQVLHLEQRGRLTPGSRADVTILDRDPLADDPQEILRATVRWTLVDGEVVYQASTSTEPGS